MNNWKGNERCCLGLTSTGYYPTVCLEGLNNKLRKTSVRQSDFRAEIGTEELPNMKQEN